MGIRLCGCEDLVGMTVLEEARMSGSLGGDRYITPEYLAPLPQVSTTSKNCILLNFQKGFLQTGIAMLFFCKISFMNFCNDFFYQIDNT